jgi:DNA-directed RNA polymerase specialized sigma subunit
MSTNKKITEFNRTARQELGSKPKSADPHEELWRKWHAGGRQERDLVPLLDAFEHVIQKQARTRTRGVGGSIPYGAMETQLRLAAKKSIESFNPDSGGAKLQTWVTTGLQRVTDFVAANRNFARIPKNRVDLYQRVQNAKNELHDELGREPSAHEISQRLPDVKPNDIQRLMVEVRTEHYIGGNPNPEAADDGSLGHAPSQMRSIISLMPSLLTSEEKKVFDQLFPSNGSPASMAEIAKRTGMNKSRVYQLRSAIFKKAKPYLP